MKNLFWGLSLAAMALLAACSSGSGTNSEPLEISSNSSSGADLFAETFDDLPVCTVNREGAIAYVKDEKAAYACEGGDWTLDDEDSTERKSNGDTDNDGMSSVYDVVTGTLTDSRDGQTYRTVKIGDQVWMAENLNFVTDNSWCYGDDPANCAKYGRLYTWGAAMDSVGEWSTSGRGCGYGKTCSVASASSVTLVRGICPKGWHLPSYDEWEALIVAVDGSITEYTYTSSNTAGSKLKSTSGWAWNYHDDIISGNGTDAFGCSALPAGNRDCGDYSSEGYSAGFWSSTEKGSNSAYHMDLIVKGVNACLNYNSGNNGFSVRCLRD